MKKVKDRIAYLSADLPGLPTEPTEPKASDKYTSNNLQPYGPSKMGRESKIGVEVAPALPKWSRTGALSA